MAKTEKIAFILEQVRLCLAKDDYIRAQILARKISPRAFQIKKGEAKGEIGIEGTAIEEADEVRNAWGQEATLWIETEWEGQECELCQDHTSTNLMGLWDTWKAGELSKYISGASWLVEMSHGG
jgi:hypothetical protein